MGRIKEYFLDKGLTARDIPLAFACVLSLFSSSMTTTMLLVVPIWMTMKKTKRVRVLL